MIKRLSQGFSDHSGFGPLDYYNHNLLATELLDAICVDFALLKNRHTKMYINCLKMVEESLMQFVYLRKYHYHRPQNNLYVPDEFPGAFAVEREF